MKKIKQITYQDAGEVGVDDDRVIITYIDDEEVIEDDQPLTEYRTQINVVDMSNGNPESANLDILGSTELLSTLLSNLTNKLNL